MIIMKWSALSRLSGRVSLEELTAKLAAEEGGEYKVLVKARVCKRYLRHAETLTEATTPELYAKWVKVKMVEPESDKAEEAGEEPKTDDGGAGTDDGSATTRGWLPQHRRRNRPLAVSARHIVHERE